MSEFIVEISGNNSLENIQELVYQQEIAGARFLRFNISYHEHRITNLVTFEEMIGRPDRKLILSRGGAPASDGMQQVWAGVILAGGQNVAITAFR